MNSNLKSGGRICREVLLLGLGFVVLIFSGCSTSSDVKSLESENPVFLAKELDAEVSLKSDREQLRVLRKDVPKDIKVENDELAMDLELMVKAEKPAHEIRGNFQNKVRKLRNRFRSKTRKVRTQFSKVQKKQRNRFLKNLKQERESFKKQKVDKSKTKEFYAAQDLNRKDFFANQKDQRKEFESEVKQKSKDFHGNMRERVKQFNEQLRIYSKRLREKERLEQKQKKQAQKERKQKLRRGGPIFKKNQTLDAEAQKILKEFDAMKSVPADPLETD